jgi:hypothetical protein
MFRSKGNGEVGALVLHRVITIKVIRPVTDAIKNPKRPSLPSSP